VYNKIELGSAISNTENFNVVILSLISELIFLKKFDVKFDDIRFIYYLPLNEGNNTALKVTIRLSVQNITLYRPNVYYKVTGELKC